MSKVTRPLRRFRSPHKLDEKTNHVRYRPASQVAYILNIRGNDVAHSPVAIAYLLVTEKEAKVFIDKAKMSVEVEAEMKVKRDSVSEYSSAANSQSNAVAYRAR